MHFQGSPGEVGWSCGYKNMQMQISHLLQQDKVLHIPASLMLHLSSWPCDCRHWHQHQISLQPSILWRLTPFQHTWRD